MQDLNERGGGLVERFAAVLGDDFCDPGQAVAAAQKLVADGAALVAINAPAPRFRLLDLGGRGHHLISIDAPQREGRGPCSLIGLDDHRRGAAARSGKRILGLLAPERRRKKLPDR